MSLIWRTSLASVRWLWRTSHMSSSRPHSSSRTASPCCNRLSTTRTRASTSPVPTPMLLSSSSRCGMPQSPSSPTYLPSPPSLQNTPSTAPSFKDWQPGWAARRLTLISRRPLVSPLETSAVPTQQAYLSYKAPSARFSPSSPAPYQPLPHSHNFRSPSVPRPSSSMQLSASSRTWLSHKPTSPPSETPSSRRPSPSSPASGRQPTPNPKSNSPPSP